ncbi:hypothetical protein [Roseovarius sp. D22-M7]|uniref:hypothetical protein n=1 Tax=Roseovarius sp. D22-M7 TaxID=3127116 RepID=UPI003010170D
MEDSSRTQQAHSLTSSGLVVALLAIAGGALAQTLPPGLDEGAITYSSDPFQIEHDTLMQGLEETDGLREIIEGNTGLSLPGQVDGLYMLPRRGGFEELDTCRVICMGENGGEPCFSSCGRVVVE